MLLFMLGDIIRLGKELIFLSKQIDQILKVSSN